MNKGYQTYQCTVVSHQDFNLGSGIKVIGKSLIQWMKIFQPFINKNFSTDDFQNNWVHPNKWTYFWIAWIVFHRLLNRKIVGKDKILPWNTHFWVGRMGMEDDRILLLGWYLFFIVLVKMENQTLHIDKESVSYEIEMRTRDFGEIKGHLRSITSYRMHPGSQWGGGGA